MLLNIFTRNYNNLPKKTGNNSFIPFISVAKIQKYKQNKEFILLISNISISLHFSLNKNERLCNYTLSYN